jgi:hypothetical protein
MTNRLSLCLIMLLWGCHSQPPLSDEALLERYESSQTEHDDIMKCLKSDDLGEIHRGLNRIQKNPASFPLYRAEVIRLNKESSDPAVVKATTQILDRH